MSKAGRPLSPKLRAWVKARKRHRLSHVHVQMARELGPNPNKLGSLDNHRQEPRDQVSELRDGENETRGGSSETDVSEFTISPAGLPSGAAVMNATPVASLPRASRNERASGPGTG
jgi:hypothetical protein